MREERYYLAMDRYDRGIILRALNDLRNKQIQENRSLDAVNEVMIKVSEAKNRKFRVIEREPAEKG